MQFWRRRRMRLELIHIVGVRKSELFPTSLRLLMSPKARSRAWCSYNLNWGFFPLGWWEDRNSPWVPHVHWEGLKAAAHIFISMFAVHAWGIAALSRGSPPWQASWASVCESLALVWQVVSNSSLPLLLPVTGLGAAFCPWAVTWWIWPPSRCKLCQPLALEWVHLAPFSSLPAGAWKRETRFPV